MKSFFRNLSSRFPFFANRPSALERAVRQSPKSRRLRMEPLENRALLAVDAFAGAASLVDSDVGATWGPDPGLVEAAQLGTTAKKRYEVVQPIGATDATKLRQTQNLTVWRTLRAELDCLTVGGETADAPLIDDFVTRELSRACVDLKAYSPNNSPNISCLAQEITKSHMQSLATFNRDASSNPWFWSTRLIGAFSINISGMLGNYENSNTIFVYNDTHETFVSEWNELHSTNFDVNVLKRRTALHEIGHALSLEHAESTVMLSGSLNQLTSLDVLLSPVNLIFSDTQLAQIQALIEPTAPRSAQETD